MIVLTEKSILKSRSGVYEDTPENRRKHRVGQKYGAEKQPEDGEKTEKKETDPAKELEAVNKVIAAINEGKLKLPQEEIMVLVEKKNNLELAKRQAEKIHSGVKANEEKRNAAEVKETSKKINEATKEAKDEGKQYASMDIKEAKKELVGKKITFKEYFFDGIDSYKDAEGEIKKVRLYGKEKQPIAEIDFPNGDGITISLEQLDKRKAMQYEIEFNDSKSEEPKQEASGQASEADKDDLREARRKLSYLQDNEERLIKRDGKEKYDKRVKQVKEVIAKLRGEKPKESQKPEYFDRTGYKPIYRMNEEEADKFISDAKKYLSENKDAKDVEQVQDVIRKVELRKEEIKETSNEEAEVYTRIKFDDVPNSGKVNLKKYLSEKVRQGVDEKWSNIKNIPTDNLKKMEKGLVNDLNKNFEAIKKSQRAELLYSIMKVKGELEKRGKESQKKE